MKRVSQDGQKGMTIFKTCKSGDIPRLIPLFVSNILKEQDTLWMPQPEEINVIFLNYQFELRHLVRLCQINKHWLKEIDWRLSARLDNTRDFLNVWREGDWLYERHGSLVSKQTYSPLHLHPPSWTHVSPSSQEKRLLARCTSKDADQV